MTSIKYSLFTFALTTAVAFAQFSDSDLSHAQTDSAQTSQPTIGTNETKDAFFAGGCFWCIEADFEKLEGVVDVVSGYTGGSEETADYKTVSNNNTGHYEAIRVRYKPDVVSYPELVEYFWRHIDPTDPNGQFCDKGESYKSAIFYSDKSELATINASLKALDASKPFKEDIVTDIVPAKPFYLAEKYHQDYYKKNPIRYRYYRFGCGRDKRIKALWGNKK